MAERLAASRTAIVDEEQDYNSINRFLTQGLGGCHKWLWIDDAEVFFKETLQRSDVAFIQWDYSYKRRKYGQTLVKITVYYKTQQ